MDASLKRFVINFEIITFFGLNIDLFLTQINRKFSNYVAYQPDPGAKFINAFKTEWFGLNFHTFQWRI